MPIASISGNSSSQPVRTNTEPVKGVSRDLKSKEKPEEEDAIKKQNKENNNMKPGVANNEEYKGVKEVDVKA
jgi:hypothetical protein